MSYAATIPAATENDWLFGKPKTSRPSDDDPPLATLEVTAPRGPNWLAIILGCALAFVLARDFRPAPSPTPDDQIVDIDGTYALVLIDNTRADQQTAEQSSAINWAGVKEFTEARGITHRRYDIKADLSDVEPVWRTLKANAEPPPSLTILRNRRIQTGPVPEGIDRLKATLAPP